MMKLFKSKKIQKTRIVTRIVECEECGNLVEDEWYEYIPSTWSRIKRFWRVKILRKEFDLQRVNKILEDVYKPAITAQLYQESPLLRMLRNERDKREHSSD